MSAQTNIQPVELDALIVGAGFSGCHLLKRLRDELKLNIKICEAGSSLGGTWHLNRYPGARVDCPVPGYEFSAEEAWKPWIWKEKYPGREELTKYFAHLDHEFSLTKDCIFNQEVVSAEFLSTERKWTVTTHNGNKIFAKYLFQQSDLLQSNTFLIGRVLTPSKEKFILRRPGQKEVSMWKAKKLQ